MTNENNDNPESAELWKKYQDRLDRKKNPTIRIILLTIVAGLALAVLISGLYIVAFR